MDAVGLAIGHLARGPFGTGEIPARLSLGCLALDAPWPTVDYLALSSLLALDGAAGGSEVDAVGPPISHLARGPLGAVHSARRLCWGRLAWHTARRTALHPARRPALAGDVVARESRRWRHFPAEEQLVHTLGPPLHHLATGPLLAPDIPAARRDVHAARPVVHHLAPCALLAAEVTAGRFGDAAWFPGHHLAPRPFLAGEHPTRWDGDALRPPAQHPASRSGLAVEVVAGRQRDAFGYPIHHLAPSSFTAAGVLAGWQWDALG